MKPTCYFCGKSFKRPSLLEIHILSQTKEEPYICLKACKASYTCLASLHKHNEKVHHLLTAKKRIKKDLTSLPKKSILLFLY